MKTFNDNLGRRWCLAINVAAVKRCRALVDVDLYGLVGDGLSKLGDLLGDPCKLADVLWVLTRGVPDNPDATDEEFGAALGGDSLGAATDAFLEELTDFFPDPRIRAGLKAVLEKGKAMQAASLDRLEATIAAMDPDATPTTSNGSSGNGPALSVSTPVLSRSGS